jgi:CRISPR/Cas system-associated exonuclease Cas4 (RecB family)
MIILSNSQIKSYKTCPQSYYYKQVEKIERKMKSLPLKRGELLHGLLEDYYNKKDWRPRLSQFAKEFDKLMEEEKEMLGGNLPEECQRIMEGYIKHYKDKKEKALAVELDFCDDPIEIVPGVALMGKIDLIMKDERGTWIVEHKTVKTIPTEDVRFLDLQTSIYSEVAKKLGYEVDGILWNYIRTKTPPVPGILKNGTVSRAQNIDTDYDTYLKTIVESGNKKEDYQIELERAKMNTFYVRKPMPKSERVTKALLDEIKVIAPIMDKLKKFPYRNINKFNCKQCDYRSLCEAELLGLDSDFIRKNEFKIRERVKEVEETEE